MNNNDCFCIRKLILIFCFHWRTLQTIPILFPITFPFICCLSSSSSFHIPLTFNRIKSQSNIRNLSALRWNFHRGYHAPIRNDLVGWKRYNSIEIHYQSSESSIKSLERISNLNGNIRFRVFPRESLNFLLLFGNMILDRPEGINGERDILCNHFDL